MIYKQFAAALICSVISLAASAQTIETNITYTNSISGADNRFIVYAAKQNLAITNFEGKPDINNDAVAITSSGFLFKAGFRNKNGKAILNILVDCSFDKQLSWMKDKGKNEYILSHEQHHFDISYISTLLFIKKLKQASLTVDNYKDQLQTIYNNAINNMEQLQSKYDIETSNGLLKDKQEIWNNKINQQLASLISE